MASLRDLRRRIKSVDGIRQITRAMEMVSATKLRRAQLRIEAARPYTEKMDEILARLSRAVTAGVTYHPLMEPHEEENHLLLVAVASNKGLCGSFNANVIRKTEAYARDAMSQDVKVTLFPIGKKIFDYFRRRKWDIHEKAIEYMHIDEKLPVGLLQEITDLLADGFTGREYDRVDMIYTEFKSAITHNLVARQFLPVVGLTGETEDRDSHSENLVDYIFEPAPEQLFRILIPKYARIVMFRMLADSLASEHGGRMNAMRNATDNAVDMIRTLTLQRNKARQAAITKELSEIVGGAEALVG